MVYELLAPRLLAPVFGTSTYVWTTVIGIVMTSLSLGYYFGGRLVDKYPKVRILSYLFLITGIFVILSSFGLKKPSIIP